MTCDSIVEQTSHYDIRHMASDNGRVQVDKAVKFACRAIKHDWLDPQVRINYTHSLGKHA